MKVAEAVGRALVGAGVGQVFGVVGSGNFHLTNAMVAAGARFVAARHEGGAATMADAYARMSGTVTVLSVHQGPGLTNALTGITEAAKSGTPLVVAAAEVTEPRSNFHVDQEALGRAVGAVPMQVASAQDAVGQACEAVRRALHERRTVLLNLPLEVQTAEVPADTLADAVWPLPRAVVEPSAADVEALAQVLARSRRPVFVAGRGARSPGARDALEALAEDCGALLATSAVARGLFRGSPWSLDVSGGFSSPLAAELITGADAIVAWGCTLTAWTTRHGRLIGPGATVVRVDDDPAALGDVLGDVELTARRVLAASGGGREGYRTHGNAEALAARVRLRDVPYDDTSTRERIDPRTLSIALDDLLPAERVVAVDSGNFMGYPTMYLSVPDEQGLCFTQAFQSIGLGLATAIGAALARPDRLPVAALGDGGALMGAAELDTVRRLGLPMVVVVYNDDAYGAEVHHFGGHPLDIVRFPETDIAAVARGYGFEAVTVRTRADLKAVADWLAGPRTAPLLVDAKVVAERGSWWLEEAFRGH
ncbi:thiamine pyrophosphate protein domain protein [Streptomyces davaonensis JCM 4913]|uniref:Thiamine pyrophosphate protein domain protein n=1 Tax=Streptomyces davaonensis (strain DSM 101723 / JCM 4913 / KCC S-0913 / 768) TaxID=1214101 RepID=K4RF45_STRDJ|nr:thiamine pyrophosphate-binding protein [Streptomyces davaonensis]CCK32247.1 thiamine pyrophosphate protein domain protein [Streptomyces davaonensis JCM 4913]